MMDESKLIKLPNLPRIQDVPDIETFRDLLDSSTARFPDNDAFILKTRRATRTEPAEYRHIKYPEFRRTVDDLGLGLSSRGLKGKRLAIIGKNSYKWLLAYYAQLVSPGICVPLDKDLPYEELVLSLERAEADILVFGKEHLELAERLAAEPEFSALTLVAMEDPSGSPFAERFIPMDKLLEEGRAASPEEREAFRTAPIDRDALAIILFTSGTSGSAKAVMLSQYNICYDCAIALSCEDVHEYDVNIAFLPFHHSFGSTGQSIILLAGGTTVFCDGLKYIQPNLQEYGVSVFVGVPLIVEAIYKKILNTVKKEGRETRFRAGMRLSGLLMKIGIDKRRAIFREVIDQLGGKLRFIISGASALDPKVAEAFNAMGINVIQGYGMTECSPIVSGEAPGIMRPGTIGRGMPGLELAICEPDETGTGELVVRGRNVTCGYYDDSESTGEALENGWMHTGDLVSVGNDGMITIRGRRKDMIVLKNGKKIFPEEIEQIIAKYPYVRENMVFGETRAVDGDSKDLVLSVRIVCDADAVRRQFGEVSEEELYELVRKDMDRVSARLPKYKRIYRVYLTEEPMERTSTGKIKRYLWKS
ncbi:MAG: AMP-binding protein [Firmicutes bacterium]|nr:AMP-binding protein [Bacillota bacterium]